MRTSVIITAGILILLMTVPGFVSADSDDDMKFYATGDPIYISGEAPGSQSTGLCAWILGQNYWSVESVTTGSDGSYIYEIDGGLTGSLSPGQYFVLIQHPMYNGVFDVKEQQGTPSSGQTSVVSTAGGSFIIDGPGKLEGSAAAYALMNLIDSQNIDDVYSVTTFYLEEPWLKADETEAWEAGNVIQLDGTTNIATGESLIYTFYPASGDIPSSKQSVGTVYTTEMAGRTYVEYDMPYNTWTVDIDTEGMEPGTYLFTIESSSNGNTVQKYIVLYESVNTPEITAEPTIQESAEATWASVSEETNSPTETQQSPMSVVFALISILSAAVIAAFVRDSRRR